MPRGGQYAVNADSYTDPDTDPDPEGASIRPVRRLCVTGRSHAFQVWSITGS